MISFIVCSIVPALSSQLKLNIFNTVGIDHEVIIIDNRNTGKGICQVYNEGALQSRFPYLCFVHEDLLFESKNWGNRLIEAFHTVDNPGVIGIAGAVYKPKTLSSWWQEPFDGLEPRRCRLTQHFKYNPFQPNLTYFNPQNQLISEVISLDGLFLCMEKKTWDEFHFDDKMLSGFHGYDLDICLSVRTRKKNYAMLDLDVHHYSEGRNDASWLTDNLKVHLKHANQLPAVTEEYQKVPVDFEKINKYWQHYWLKQMISWKLNFSLIRNYYHALMSLTAEDSGNNSGKIMMEYVRYFIEQAKSKWQDLYFKVRRGLKKLMHSGKQV